MLKLQNENEKIIDVPTAKRGKQNLTDNTIPEKLLSLKAGYNQHNSPCLVNNT